MFKDVFTVLLLGHVLGDFYFQNEKIAQEKIKSTKWLSIHCLCYCASMIVAALAMDSMHVTIGAIVVAILHMIIDAMKYVYLQSKYQKRTATQVVERNVFIVDQVFHGVCLVGVAYWIVVNTSQIGLREEWIRFFEVIGISGELVLKWCLTLLLVHKPANIAIQKVLMPYKPQKQMLEIKKDNNAGRFIGSLERMIMLIFLAIEQYSAIGLVLTAKSIARYDRISKESDFAEYYLLGTLISTVIVIVCSFII